MNDTLQFTTKVSLHEAQDRTAPIQGGRVPRIARLMALAIHCDQLVREGIVRDQAQLARLGHVSQARISQILAPSSIGLTNAALTRRSAGGRQTKSTSAASRRIAGRESNHANNGRAAADAPSRRRWWQGSRAIGSSSTSASMPGFGTCPSWCCDARPSDLGADASTSQRKAARRRRGSVSLAAQVAKEHGRDALRATVSY